MYSYIDMHCDTLQLTLQEGSHLLYENSGMQSLRYMQKVRQMCQFFAIFFPPREEKQEMSLPPDEEFFKILQSNLVTEVEKHSDFIAMAYNYEDIMRNWQTGRSSAILTVEDGRMVNGKMENISYLYKQGVRAIALTWNFSNCFGYPNSNDANSMKKGLTDFGKEALAEMTRLGILIDVSHLSDGGFLDVARLSKKPFIASHSNCRKLTPHPRNLTDEMIRILSLHGGVAGINFCPAFVGKSDENISKVDELVEHVLHFMQIGGEDCIGIGSDFDGIEGQLEIAHPTQMSCLFDALKKKGVTSRQLDKFASGNVLRVIRDVM